LRIAEFTLLAPRFLLAAVFLLAGATKLIDPVGSRKALRDFGLPGWFARPMLLLLPLLELAVAASLIPASLAWYGARGGLVLLAAFSVAVAVAMIRGRKPDCHCFGQLHSAPVGWPTLVRNGVLAVCAIWLASRAQGQLGPDLWTWLGTWYDSLGVEARKFALVAACVAAFVFLRLLLRSRPRSQPAESPMAADIAQVEEEHDEHDEEPPRQPPPTVQTKRTAPPPAQSPAPVVNCAMGLGLPIGTPAPEFELMGMTGEKRSSQSLRKQGRDVLLVFSSPFCKPCQSLPSDLVRWARQLEKLPNIVLISKGTAEDNRPRLKEFGTSQVLLQKNSEVAEMYDCIATPAAVLVGADGLVRSDLAQGGPAIKELLSSWTKLPEGSASSH
jgi:peroxiredoxin